MPKLIDLFNERQDDLYSNARYPFKKPEDSEPFVYTRVSEAEPMNPRFEDQSNPISISAQRDFTRMFEFSKSPNGLIFLGKQQFLQTGNTFAQTRLYNPLNVQLHSVPFVHKSRHVNIKQTIDSILGQQNNYATLQLETISEYKTKGETRAKQKGGTLTLESSAQISFANALVDRISSSVTDKLDSFVNSVRSGFSSQFNSPVETDWNLSRPELRIGNGAGFYEYLKIKSQDSKKFGQDQLPYNRPDPLLGKKSPSYQEQVRKYKNITSAGEPVEGKFERKLWRDRYVKDRSQLTPSVYRDNIQKKTAWDKDIIDVLFVIAGRETDAIPGANAGYGGYVRFTAFIQDINETVTPTYNESKYIGRYETFYTYDKVIRDLSFSLTLQAFSQRELAHIQRKMNWLTSLTYPEKTGNYLTPTIVKLTIGNIYLDQPVLLQSLTHTIDNDTSWDIDEKHPMTIESDIQMRLLDKRHYTPGAESGIYGPQSGRVIADIGDVELAPLEAQTTEESRQFVEDFIAERSR